MNKQFQVGDLVIMQDGLFFPELNGSLALIVGDCMERRAMNMATMEYDSAYLYEVRVIREADELTINNGLLCVRSWQMRPLKDSNDDEQVKELLDLPTTV